MAGFYEIISRKILPYYNLIVVFVLFVIFSVAGYYIYIYFIGKQSVSDDSIVARKKTQENPKLRR